MGQPQLVKQLIDTVMSTSREDQQRLLEDHMATRNNTGADNDQVNLQRLLARRSEMDDQLEMTAGMRLNRAMTALSDREKQLIGQDAVSVGPSAAELYGKMGY